MDIGYHRDSDGLRLLYPAKILEWDGGYGDLVVIHQPGMTF